MALPAVSRAQQRWAYWAEAHPEESGVKPETARDFQTTVKDPPERKQKKPKADRHRLAEAIRSA
jgi:hypothetical protein